MSPQNNIGWCDQTLKTKPSLMKQIHDKAMEYMTLPGFIEIQIYMNYYDYEHLMEEDSSLIKDGKTAKLSGFEVIPNINIPKGEVQFIIIARHKIMEARL